jgi:rhomboid protease GluP
MDGKLLEEKNELVMKLLHYFITVEEYNPIILHGAEDEIWLEKLNGSYKIVRIVTNYIHNNEQFNFDLFKTKKILKIIKRKTFSFKMNVLNIFINLGDNVEVESVNNLDCVQINNEKDFKKYDFVLESYPDILSKTKYTEDGVNLFVKITNDINKKNEEESKKTNDIFKSKKPYITYSIIALNIFLYLMMELSGGSLNADTLLRFGALTSSLVKDGQYFRLITSAFLHIGLIHLLFNTYVLYVVGTQIENFYGRFKFLSIYLFSALTGSLMSIIFNNTISAGASGAIFGLLGSLLYFGYHFRIYLGNALRSQIIPLIVLNLSIGFILVGVDNAAHIGGLIGGTIISIGLGVQNKSSKFEKINGYIISLIFVMFLIYMAFAYTN